MAERSFTKADRDYLHANFLTLDDLCSDRRETPEDVRRLINERLLPQPSYVVDGEGMFPPDYFGLYDEADGTDCLRRVFEGRYRQAARDHPQLATDDAVNSAWRAYLAGIWGQCLRDVTPESIVRKRALVDSLCKLIALPRPRSAEWRKRLRAEVGELDEIERAFAPDYDRAPEWNERPPTRDLLVVVAHERFADVFAENVDLVTAR